MQTKFVHNYYTRQIPPERTHSFVPSETPAPPTQLVFDFLYDVAARDPNAPDEIALQIVRNIFRDGSAEGWAISTDAAVTKIHTHREHEPPDGIPERRKTFRREEPPQQPIRQAMRSPAMQRVDMGAVRATVADPNYVLARNEAMRHAAEYSPWRRLVICLLVVVAYAQMLNSPEQVRAGWEIAGQFFTNAKMIADVIDKQGIKGWTDKPAGVPAAVAKGR